MKKIAFIVTSLGSGGAERNVLKLSSFFANNGNEIFIFPLFSKNIFYNFPPSVHICFLVGPHKKRILNINFWTKEIKKSIVINKIDTVIAIGLKYGVLSAFALRKEKNVNLFVRGTETHDIPKYLYFLLIFSSKYICGYIAQTEAQLKTFPKKLQKKTTIISNPFLTYSENNNLTGFYAKRFIVVARYELKQKRQDFILKAFSIFLKKNKNYVLDFYGGDPSNGINIAQLKNIASDENISDRVNFFGSTENIAEKIKNSTAFLCASVFEGMPNALIESQLLGIPSISVSWSGIENIVLNNVNGYICQNSISGMANSMEIIVSNEDNYKKLSHNAFCLKKDDYDEDMIFQKWVSLLKI